MDMPYIPKIIDDQYALFLVQLEKCPTCLKKMVSRPQLNHSEFNTFPYLLFFDFNTQAKNADIVIKSYQTADNNYICEDCSKKGKAYFICSLCNERKTSDKEKEQFGDPREFLCIDCYKSVSAEIWEHKKEELYKRHRYDFE